MADAPDRSTVLIVEDDPRIASFMTKGLRAHGFGVEWVKSGGEGMARLQAGGVDLYLLDLGLPDVDGLDVMRTLRHRGIEVPVVIVTARTDPRDREAAIALGARHYLTKPFPWSDLLDAVRDCLGGNAPRSDSGSPER